MRKFELLYFNSNEIRIHGGQALPVVIVFIQARSASEGTGVKVHALALRASHLVAGHETLAKTIQDQSR